MKYLLLFLSFAAIRAFAAGPAGGAIQGTLLAPGGAPVTLPSVNFKVQILDKNSTCVLYEEEHLAQNLSATNGDFSFDLGEGTSRVNNVDSSAALKQNVFRNDVNIGSTAWCPSGLTFASGDARMIRVQYDVGGGYALLTPDMRLQGSVYSVVAETLQGKSPTDFVTVRDDVATDLSQSNLENIFSSTNYTKLNALLNGTGTLSMNNQRITDVANPTAATDAATKDYSDKNVGGKAADLSGVGPSVNNGYTMIWDATAGKWTTGVPNDSSKLPLAGGTMTGPIAMGAQNITNIGHMTIAAQRTLHLGAYTTMQENALIATPLVAADKGKTWFNTDDNVLKLWDGTRAVTMAGTTNLGQIDPAMLQSVLFNGGNTNAADVSMGTNDNYAVHLVSNGAERMYLAKDGKIGIGTTAPNHAVEMQSTDTLTTATQVSGLYINRVADAAGNSSAFPEGIDARVGTATGNAFNYTSSTGMNGAQFQANHFGTGTLTAGTGSYSRTVNRSTGTIVTATGAHGQVNNTSSGTINTAISLEASLTNTGTVGTWRGLYVPASTGNAPSTGRFPIYVADPGVNYLAGNVGVGTTSPAARLSVQQASDLSSGGISVSNSLASRTGFLWVDAAQNTRLDSSSAGIAPLLLNAGGGTVGIGTTSPVTRLQVYGTSSGTDNILGTDNTTGILTVGGSAGNHIAVDTNEIQARGGNSPSSLFLNYKGGDLILGAATSNVFANGQVALGSTAVTAGARLDVVGIGSSYSSLIVPRDTTAGRPTTGVNGMVRYNTSTDKFEFYQAGSWTNYGSGSGSGDFLASGSVPMTGNFRANGHWLSGDGGDEGIYVDTSGNVGVGVSAPGGKLDVNGLLVVRDVVQAPSGSAAFPAYTVGGAATGAGMFYPAAGTLAFSTVTAERMRIDSQGNVGIGTTSPSALLNLQGPATGNGLLVRAGETDGVDYILKLQDQDGSLTAMNVDSTGEVSLPADLDASLTGGGTLIIGPTSSLNLAIDGNEILARNNGGTSSLYLQNDGGSSIFGGSVDINYNDGVSSGAHTLLRAYRKTGTSAGIGLGYVANGTADTAGMIRAVGGATDIVFANDTGTERMRIKASGNVGIGTTNPTATLEVNGTIKATAFDGPINSSSTVTTGAYTINSDSDGAGADGGINFRANGTDLLTASNAGVVTIPATTTTSSATTGALVVNGGIGVGGNIYGGGFIRGGYIMSNASTATVYAPASASLTWPNSAAAGGNMIVQNSSNTDNSSALTLYAANNASGNVQRLYAGAVSIGGTANYSPTFVIGQQTGPNAYAERMRIDGNGNVGIGTTAPTDPLHVIGRARADILSVTNVVNFLSDGTGNLAVRPTNNVVKFQSSTGSVDYMTINADKVGIGITNPGFHLQVAHSGNDPTSITTGDPNTLNSVTGIYLRSQSEGRISVANGGAQTFYTNGLERVRITNGGNVGIGTTSPNSRFEVAATNVASPIRISRTDNVNHGASYASIPAGTVSAANPAWASGMLANQSFYSVATNDGTNTTERLAITTDGNVGIGTTSAARLFHVNGAMRLQPTALPVTPAAGDLAIDGGAGNALKYHNGTNWVSLAVGGTGDFLANGSVPMTGNFRSGGNWISGDGGNEGVFIDNSGNVGVGTSSLGYKFNVSGDINLNGSIGALFTNFFNTSQASINADNSFRINIDHNNNDANAAFTIGNNAATGATAYTNALFMVQEGGNVGIGTTNPQEALALFKVGTGPKILLESPNSLANGQIVFTTYMGGAYSYSAATTHTTMGAYGTSQAAPLTSAFQIWNSKGPLNFSTGATANNAVVIDAGGKVGIGTTSPAAGSVLDVVGLGTSYSSIIVPRDVTGSRPTTGVNGMLRYNTSTAKFEAYEGNTWKDMITSGGTSTAGAGTESAPSYSFSTDADTGWYLPAANTLAASTNAVERVRINASGQVGIGTSAPTDMLHISGNGELGVRVDAASNTTYLNPLFSGYRSRGTIASPTAVQAGDTLFELAAFGYDGSAQKYVGAATLLVDGATGPNDIPTRWDFATSPDGSATPISRFTIGSDGNIGIGTSTPNRKLDIQGGGINITGDYLVNDTSVLGRSGSDVILGDVGSNGLKVAFLANSAERMRIDSSGKVGIGTSTPANLLSVGITSYLGQTSAPIGARANGDSFEWGHGNPAGYASTLGANAGDGRPYICLSCEAGTTNNTYRTRGLKGAIIRTDNAGGIDFATLATASADDQTAARRMVITNAGNVGIGTTNPGALLEVNGRIKSGNTRQQVTAGSQTTTSSTYVDVTGLSLTVTTGNQPVMIMANLGGCWNDTASATGTFQLLEDGVAIATGVNQYVNNSDVKNVGLQWMKTPTAGSHTYKVQWKTSAGTLQCGWSASTMTLMVWE